MPEPKKPPQNSATSKADTMALIAEAEAEAAEAEALAAAARARARAARLRREALAQATQEDPEADPKNDAGETKAQTTDEPAATEVVPAADEDPVDTNADEAETQDEPAETPDDAENPGETEDAEEAASRETAQDAEPESGSARSRRRLRLPSWSVTWKAAAVVLICVFVAASVCMMWQRHEISERNQRAANFLAGAKQGVVNMTSLDFNRAKEDVQRVIDSSTGQFRDDFQQRAKDFITVVEQSKVVTEGNVTAAAVQSMDGNSAVVLVAATSRITNAAGAKDEPRRWRLKVTVTEDGGQYKMSKLEFIP